MLPRVACRASPRVSRRWRSGIRIDISHRERRSNERRFLFQPIASNIFREFFLRFFLSVAPENIWPPIGRITYNSLLSDRARDQALDIERRSARRPKENRFRDDVNRLNGRTA